MSYLHNNVQTYYLCFLILISIDLQATNQKKLKIYRTQESDKREVTFAGTDSVQLVTIQRRAKPGIHREYDEFTLACLAIEFPSADVKTEGIPKVSVPHSEHEER